MRAGKGKRRNHRRIQRRGFCIIYKEDNGIIKAFRIIPGITLLTAKNHKLWVDRAAAAPEAKSDEKGVPGKMPVVGKKGKKVAGFKEQKTPLVGKQLQLPRNQQLRRSPQNRNPPQKKRSLQHELKFVYPIKVKPL
uniref:Uncharacterized protein n=1 Tax=Molossus molossus TaxID=27622 RepID=A0A7J8J0U4_MOLMO|nr:hypothetical protein HJG59_010345 [Molossus molossus]